MDSILFLKALLYLLGIIALIFFAAKVAQYYFSKGNLSLYGNKERRLKIEERAALDTKRTLIRFSDSKYSYLMLLGVQGEQLLNKEPVGRETGDEATV